jgi:hypothetical protein
VNSATAKNHRALQKYNKNFGELIGGKRSSQPVLWRFARAAQRMGSGSP